MGETGFEPVAPPCGCHWSNQPKQAPDHSAYEGGSGATGLKVYAMQQWYSFDHLKPVDGIEKPKPDLTGYKPITRIQP